MTRFQMFMRRVFQRQGLNAPTPQINPGPGGPVIKVPKTGIEKHTGPQINPGPGVPLASFPAAPSLGYGKRVEVNPSSRPFGAAQDDVIF